MNNDDYNKYLQQGFKCLVSEDYKKSIENYEKARELYPNKFNDYNNLGFAYLELKDYKNAIENFNKAIKINSDIWRHYSNLGETYLKLKDYENAIPNLKQAIKLNPNQVDMYNLRDVYTELTDYSTGIDFFVDILKNNINKNNLKDDIIETIYEILGDLYQGLFYKEAVNNNYNSIIKDCNELLYDIKDNIWANNFILYNNKLSNLETDYKYICENNFIKVNSLQELYTEIQNVKDDHLEDNLAFRGYNRSSWGLTPLLYRNSMDFPDNLKRMKTFLESFKIQAPARTHLDFKRYNDLDFMGIMQHYGTPTPLLDWTLSLEIALFFSLDKNKNTEKDNFGIPCLSILAYNELTSEENMKNTIENDYKENKTDEKVHIFMPTRIHSRTDSQHSVFSYHESKNIYSNKFNTFEDDKKLTIYKIALMPQAVKEINLMLKLDQITPDFIYQDLQKLGERISSQSYNYTDSKLSYKSFTNPTYKS